MVRTIQRPSGRPLKGILPSMPLTVADAAQRIAAVPGVVGVFFERSPARAGSRRRDYKLIAHVTTRGPDLAITDESYVHHTMWGLAPHTFATKAAAPIDIDVVEVGRASVHELDHLDKVRVPGSSRLGTLTVVASAEDGARALLSAHVCHPRVGGKTVRNYPGGGPAKVAVDAVQTDAVTYEGRLVRGSLGGMVDWALVHFLSTLPAQTDIGHYAAFHDSPVLIRRRPLREGQTVRHASMMRNRRIEGTLRAFAASPAKLRLDDEEIPYEGLVVVESPAKDDFSVPGDSGSLVVDDSRLAWGVIVGASDDGRRAYVLTLPPLINALGSDAKRFFAL